MFFWIADANPAPDVYAAFRAEFELTEQAEVELLVFGVSWFVCWLDGEYLTEGPARFDLDHPEHEVIHVALPAGRHVLAIQAHHIGIDTRILEAARPFVRCAASIRGSPVELSWKGIGLPAYASQVRRVNPQLGWIEWCDTRQLPADWQALEYDDAAWPAAVPVETPWADSVPVRLGPMQRIVHDVTPVGEGRLANVYGYELDDPPARFFLRDLECEQLPHQGVWRRYDLGRVRLGKPRITLDVPEGAVVEMAYAESLTRGRVAPYINLSAGASANMDHYTARGGVQTFDPLTPKGGRFVEVHVVAPPGKVGEIRFLEEQFIERSYYGEPEGSFRCSDPLLERIWMTGVETLRACAEDAITDNPTRERGQWTGDVVGVGIDIAAVAYRDLRIFRRGLVQSAQSARDDGLVAGMAPGGSVYLSSYAAQWITACIHYFRLTGDRTLLDELWGAAQKNLAALERDPEDPGIPEGVAWNFIDWGYDPPKAEIDPALNLHYLDSLHAMGHWAGIMGEDPEVYQVRFDVLRDRLTALIRAAIDEGGWDSLGYHATALALDRGFFSGAAHDEAEDYMKRHLRRCFPNDPAAPRLSDPTVQEKRLITPYFAHYAFPALIERANMPFILDQFRSCWGWALDTGATTWLEVFDTRWSHSHQWAGCPTWQLSRYTLGLHHRFDRGMNHFDFHLAPGGLDWAEGALPLPEGEVRISWVIENGQMKYTLEPTMPIHVTGLPGEEEPITITESTTWLLK
jgi:hypothetical protein